MRQQLSIHFTLGNERRFDEVVWGWRKVDYPSTSISTHLGDPDLADLAEEVSFAEVIETATVAGIAGELRTHAELGVVSAVVHELAPVRTMHLPGQTSVEEQFV